MERTVRLTTAQALVRFLAHQSVERDGLERPFFAACFGAVGHGYVAGVGQARHERPDLLRYFQARSEQAMVHTAVGYTRMKNRLADFSFSGSLSRSLETDGFGTQYRYRAYKHARAVQRP